MISLSSAPTRCGFTVPFWLTYTNVGTDYASGGVALQIDDLTTFIGADSMPVSVIGNEILWEFSNLQPTYSEKFRIDLEMPGVAELGNLVNFNSELNLTDITGTSLHSSTNEYISTINCAYDPNDKQVFPARVLTGEYDENYTLFSEELHYLIRFQNTGTDTAFTVVIKDNLSQYLDRSTFTPISASHFYQTTLDAQGNIAFTFPDILLPDSLTNEPESHGFVSFKIRPLQDISDFTQINNSAEIYFDFNPPIITNTTRSIIVEEFPQAPVVDFNFATNDLTVIFEDSSENSPFAWLWDFGDTNTSEVQNPTHEYTEEGIYNICLTAQNNIGSNTFCQDVNVMASSVRNASKNTFRVIPNPTSGLTQIILNATVDAQRSVIFYNSSGQIIELHSEIENNQVTFTANNQTSGIYFFQIYDKSEIILGKFIIK